MKGYFGVFLLVACFLPAFGRSANPEMSGDCTVFSQGGVSPWTDTYHEHLDGTQHLKVTLVNPRQVGVRVVGSNLVVCDKEGRPELELTDDGYSVLVSRSNPDNKHGYLELTNYVEIIGN